jgi:hypothetical protein
MNLLSRTLLTILLLLCLVIARGQTAWTADPKTGCKAYNPDPQPTDSISWTGGCRNGLLDGEGTLIWFDNGKEQVRITAPFREGKAEGNGKYVLPNGQGNAGYFIEGQIVDLDKTYLSYLKKNKLDTPDANDNYVGDGKSTSLFYYSAIPPQKIKGVLVLLCGTWETAELNISSNKKLVQMALDSGIAVIVPSLNQRLSLNEDVLGFLNDVFSKAIATYRLPSDKFVIGGFSMGGLFSIRYAEFARESAQKTAVVPAAVFSVDGPTDLESLYGSFERRMNNPRNKNKLEAEYGIRELTKFVGGSPATHHEQYVYYSTYSHTEKDGGNARFLENMPVRIYNDVDVDWWIRNRGSDLYEMNALDQSALINHLISVGNTRAEFINALGKGYRPDGSRHPHAWSIVDAEDCMRWIMGIIDKQ